MPQVDVIEESFVVASPETVAARVRDVALWRALWPDLSLEVSEDRGPKGLRWTVSGPLVGTCEVWLEPYGDGVVVHCYLRSDRTARGDPTTPVRVSARRALRETRRRQRHLKTVFWALKDELEGGRPAGIGGSSGGRDVPKTSG